MPQSSCNLLGRFCLLFMALLTAFWLVGCSGGKSAQPAVNPSGAAVAAPQDSLRAKFLLTIVQADDKEQSLDAVLFSVPGKRYRMELTGPMGIGVASLLWTEESWLMTFPMEKLYVKGAGYMVGLLNDNTLPLVHIHQVAALFEGKLLPEKYERLDSTGSVVKAVDGAGRKFSYEVKDSHVVRLSYDGRNGLTETLRFSNFREFEGRTVPEIIVFEQGDRKFLEIKIKKVNHNKPFSGGTWKLNVPRSFTPVES